MSVYSFHVYTTSFSSIRGDYISILGGYYVVFIG